MDCSLPGSSIHGIFQATVLEWGAIAFSQGSYNNLQICFWETIPPTFLIFKFLGLLILSTATGVDRQPKTSQTDLIWSNTTTLLGVIRHKQTKWEGYKPAETYLPSGDGSLFAKEAKREWNTANNWRESKKLSHWIKLHLKSAMPYLFNYVTQ